MRVLHIGKYYAPARGGIERTTQDLAEWLSQHGVDVTALVHQLPGRWRGEQSRIGQVDIVRTGCFATLLYTPLSPSFPFVLANLLRNFRPDILHLHLPNPSCFAALFNLRARQIPWVVHWHADVSPEAINWRLRAAYHCYRPFEQALLARARAVIATSQTYSDASAALAPWHSKTHIIPLGVDDVSTHKTQQRDGIAISSFWPPATGLRLLSVGRMSHFKGFNVLLDALVLVPAASLVLVGKGECEAALRQQVIRAGLSHRVHFTGELSDATGLLDVYAGADAFVLPSLNRSESFGLVLLEAMRAGLPIVASAIPGSGVNEVVISEKTGLLIPPGDASALSTALNQLASDPNLRYRFGQAGLQRWRDRFTLDCSAEQVLALYQDVLLS